MRKQRSGQTGCGKRLVASVVAMTTALGLGTLAWAQAQLPAFGMIGLAEGQTAILNLVLVNPPAGDHPGCRVRASFVDASGQVFRNGMGHPIESSFTLQPQIATGLRLRSTEILTAGQLRRSIRAVLTPVPHDTTPSDCTCLIATLELVNPDGRTAVFDLGLGTPGTDVLARTPGGGNPPPPPGQCTAG